MMLNGIIPDNRISHKYPFPHEIVIGWALDFKKDCWFTHQLRLYHACISLKPPDNYIKPQLNNQNEFE